MFMPSWPRKYLEELSFELYRFLSIHQLKEMCSVKSMVLKSVWAVGTPVLLDWVRKWSDLKHWQCGSRERSDLLMCVQGEVRTAETRKKSSWAENSIGIRTELTLKWCTHASSVVSGTSGRYPKVNSCSRTHRTPLLFHSSSGRQSKLRDMLRHTTPLHIYFSVECTGCGPVCEKCPGNLYCHSQDCCRIEAPWVIIWRHLQAQSCLTSIPTLDFIK